MLYRMRLDVLEPQTQVRPNHKSVDNTGIPQDVRRYSSSPLVVYTSEETGTSLNIPYNGLPAFVIQ